MEGSVKPLTANHAGRRPRRLPERALTGAILLTFLSFLWLPLGAVSYGKPLSITDDAGRTVALKEAPKRIVSLYPAHSENLLALGLKDRMVGIAQGDDGELFKGVPKLPLRPDPEAILRLKPDLVLVRSLQLSMQPNLLDRISPFVAVAGLDPPSPDGLESYIIRLGVITGREAKARSKLREALNTLEQSRRRNHRSRKGAFLVVNSKDITTCSPGSWAYRLMEATGLSPAAEDPTPTSEGSAVARFGPERLLMLDKKVDVILVQQGPMNHGGAAEFLSDPRFSPMRAVKQGNVFQVDEKMISRPSLLRLNGAIKVLEGIGRKAR
ncbi:MAG: ABC transporter substrate-binding protein [Thermanaerothrix sp.]|nr:ABC transporter substrate-binding protein [Thermanaerothrix sp.]